MVLKHYNAITVNATSMDECHRIGWMPLDECHWNIRELSGYDTPHIGPYTLGPKYVNAKTVAWRVMLWFLDELMWFLVELIWLLDINIGRRNGIEDLDNEQDVFGEFNVKYI